MTMPPVNLVIGMLAVWHVVEVIHHGEIFASLRARAELSDTFLSRILLCPFCLTVWVALAVCPFALPMDTENGFWYAVHRIGYAVMVAFAIARLANLGNDLTHARCRTPRGFGDGLNSGIKSYDRTDHQGPTPV